MIGNDECKSLGAIGVSSIQSAFLGVSWLAGLDKDIPRLWLMHCQVYEV